MTALDEPWIRRLRDGETAKRWPVLLAAAITTAVGLGVLVAELASPDFLRGLDSTRAQSNAILWPVLITGFGLLLAVATWSAGRTDRRTLARIRAHPAPRFHLPVSATGLRTTDDLPRPRPEVWTADTTGLHAWAPSRADPVFELPWARIRRFSVATRDSRGQQVDFGVWISTTVGADVVVQPRSALGRGFEAGPDQLEAIVRVLRSLQRELGPRPDASDRR